MVGSKKGYWLWMLFFGIAMIILNLLDVMTLSDDLLYRFIWQADERKDPQLLESLSDLFQSQFIHYQVQNGRAVVHTLGQAMLTLVPTWLFQLVNGLLAVLLLHLCVCFSNCRDNQRLLVSIIAGILLFIVMRGVRTTMLWSIGTVNYLWVTVATLAFILFLKKIGTRKSLSFSFSQLLILSFSPLALLVGWSHEGLSLPVTSAFIVFIVANRKQLTTAFPASVLYMFWYALGSLFCLLSPGIWDRAAEGITLWSRMLTGCLNMVFNVRVLWLLLLCMAVLWFRNRERLKSIIRSEYCLFVALLVSFTIMFLCGTSLERVAFFVDFIALLILLRNFLPSGRLNPLNSSNPLNLLCIALLLIFFTGAALVRQENAKNFMFMEKQMQEPGKEIIAVRQPVSGQNPLMDFFRERYVNPTAEFGFYCSYMGFDSNDINMRCAAKLYGKQSLVFLPEDVLQNIMTNSTAYQHCQSDKAQKLYVWQMRRQHPVSHLIFELNDEDPSQLLPHQRLVAYHDDTYELDPFNYEVITLQGRSYLVFTKPTTNIFRRIKRVVIL